MSILSINILEPMSDAIFRVLEARIGIYEKLATPELTEKAA